MEYLHTMIRVRDLDSALDFFVNKLGLGTSPEGRRCLKGKTNNRRCSSRFACT